MKNSLTSKPKNRRGATMVEFAIVAPIVFFLFFTAFEFSRVAMIRHTADNAVYEAARRAILPGASAADARQEAQQILNSLGLRNTSVDITPTVIRPTTRDVTVQIAVPLDSNSFVPNQFFGGETIRTQLTMRREGNRP